jgi:hypothetical protein
MFGKGKERLLQEGAVAQGVVIQNKATMTVTGIDPKYHVKVRVKFDDGTSTEFKQALNAREVGRHFEGAVVPVRYDPADHSKIEIDVPALTLPTVDRAALHQDAIARAEQAIAQGTAPASGRVDLPSAASTYASDEPIDDEWSAAYTAAQAVIGDTSVMTAFIAAKKAGNAAEAQRLKPLIAEQNAKVQTANAELQRLNALRKS